VRCGSLAAQRLLQADAPRIRVDRPSYHQRIESAAAWQPLPDDGLPRFEGPAPQTTAAAE
jgi:hypothetical protein